MQISITQTNIIIILVIWRWCSWCCRFSRNQNHEKPGKESRNWKLLRKCETVLKYAEIVLMRWDSSFSVLKLFLYAKSEVGIYYRKKVRFQNFSCFLCLLYFFLSQNLVLCQDRVFFLFFLNLTFSYNFFVMKRFLFSEIVSPYCYNFSVQNSFSLLIQFLCTEQFLFALCLVPALWWNSFYALKQFYWDSFSKCAETVESV